MNSSSPPLKQNATLTDQLKAQLADAVERNNIFQNILDNIPSMVGYWDSNLLNKYSNTAYLEYFNKTKAEIEGIHIRDLLGPEIFQKNQAYIEAALRGEPQSFERELPLRLGGTRHTQAHYVPDVRNGQVYGFFVVVFDISPLKQATEEKEKIYQQVSESYKMIALGEMAGGVAHEINTPLGIISMNTQFIEEIVAAGDFAPHKITKHLETIKKTTNRIAKIVTGLLMFSQDRNEDSFKKVSLSSIFEDTLPFCYERFRAHDIELICPSISPDLLISCRPVQISQILVNLLNNAFDAVETCHEKWVSLKVFENANHIEIHVQDSGPGVPNEVQDKIMQPFFTTKNVNKGTGLGLSISRGIAEGHGGSLALDRSSPHTNFVLRLPKPKHSQKL